MYYFVLIGYLLSLLHKINSHSLVLKHFLFHMSCFVLSCVTLYISWMLSVFNSAAIQNVHKQFCLHLNC